MPFLLLSFLLILLLLPNKDLMDVFEINAVGPLLVAQALAPLLEAQRASEPTKAVPIYAFLTSKVGSVEDNGSGG